MQIHVTITDFQESRSIRPRYEVGKDEPVALEVVPGTHSAQLVLTLPDETTVTVNIDPEDLDRVLSFAECEVPPAGWWCSRGSGHEGPCAARQIGDADDEDPTDTHTPWYTRWWRSLSEGAT